jgi:hypothetical protein
MPVTVKLVTPESGAIRKRMKEISDSIDPHAPRMDRFRYKVTAIRKKDNEDMLYRGTSMMAGEDRRGRPLARPAASTVKGYERKGLIRQVLAPHGLGSRTMTRFFTRWTLNGRVWEMADGWKNIPWMVYHLLGAPRGSKPKQPNWSLPRRDIGGWSLKGLVQFRKAFKDFSARVFKEA